MNILEFIAAVVGSVAWPTSLVVVSLLFHKQIVDVVSGLRRFRYRELEMEFERDMDELKEKAKEAGIRFSYNDSISEEIENVIEDAMSDLRDIAMSSPEAAIGVSWSFFEKEIGRVSEDLGISIRENRPNSALEYAMALRDAGYLNDHTVEVVKESQKLRNDAVHTRLVEFEPDFAIDYINVVRGLIRTLHAISRTE
ncbi:MAG: hypothetical protein JJ878_07245 [Alphaproteobacteria bacterium]|nr:hypothetical protein [Alphaproteobacteria bacterium]MBO6862415.1 hypothetical protein [Alphaproteobacteria bacterium]